MKILNFVTVLNIAVIITILIFYPNKPNFDFSRLEAGGRNNSSTPPTFVLPATPAVAEIQERRNTLDSDEIIFCAVRLYDHGFNNFSLNRSIDNIYLTVELLKYQNNRNLPMSGEFDQKTKESLNC